MRRWLNTESRQTNTEPVAGQIGVTWGEGYLAGIQGVVVEVVVRWGDGWETTTKQKQKAKNKQKIKEKQKTESEEQRSNKDMA